MRALYAIDVNDPHAEADAVAAASLTRRLGATVDLLYVEGPVPDVVLDAPTEELRPLLEAAKLRHDCELHLRMSQLFLAFPPELRGRTLLAEVEVSAEAIVSRTTGYDVVLVGTHGRRGLSRAWHGSISELVVRCSHVPVLVVRDSQATADPLCVLAAVDPFDVGARGLVTMAARWAHQLGARLDLIHVVSGTDPADRLTPSHVIWSNALRGVVQKAKSRLADLTRTLPLEVPCTIGVEFGDPCELISNLSADYTLTVVRTHGRRGIARMYLGSVSEHVVREAASPVLVLPGPQPTDVRDVVPEHVSP